MGKNQIQIYVNYIAQSEWIWYKGGYLPHRIVFISTYNPSETLVVLPTEESLNEFTYADVLKNLNTFPLKVFQEHRVEGKEFRVPINEINKYLSGFFYEKVLKEQDGWDVLIGTDDMATFIYLEPLLPEKVFFMGELKNAEEEAMNLAEKNRWERS